MGKDATGVDFADKQVRDLKIKAKKGFSYYIEDEILKEYKGFSVERKLSWLQAANDMKNGLSAKTRKLRDKFRKAKV